MFTKTTEVEEDPKKKRLKFFQSNKKEAPNLQTELKLYANQLQCYFSFAILEAIYNLTYYLFCETDQI